jgi:NADH-quinone oxidoreductase subunit N
MALGAFAAIGQKNIKRLMAYSSIGHMGYALVGLAAGTQAGVRASCSTWLIYLVMTLGTFACIMRCAARTAMVENVSDLAGLSRTNPFMAFPDHDDVLAGRHSAARRLLRQVLRLPRRHRSQALCAGRHRRAGLGGRRLLLSARDIGVRAVLLISAAFVLVLSLAPAPLLNSAAAAAKSLF